MNVTDEYQTLNQKEVRLPLGGDHLIRVSNIEESRYLINLKIDVLHLQTKNILFSEFAESPLVELLLYPFRIVESMGGFRCKMCRT
jgi:hypothetical protein